MADEEKIPGATFIDKHREADSKANYYVPDNGPVEFFSDGMASLSLSASVAKVDFFRTDRTTEERGDSIEHRVVTHRLVIPVGAFVEMCAKSLTGISQTREPLLQAFDQTKEKILLYSGGTDGADDIKVKKK